MGKAARKEGGDLPALAEEALDKVVREALLEGLVDDAKQEAGHVLEDRLLRRGGEHLGLAHQNRHVLVETQLVPVGHGGADQLTPGGASQRYYARVERTGYRAGQPALRRWALLSLFARGLSPLPHSPPHNLELQATDRHPR